MKRIYTFALASMIATTASAFSTFDRIIETMPAHDKTELSLHRDTPLKMKNAVRKAPSPDTVWSDWEMAGTGTFIMDSSFADFTGLTDWQGDFPGINLFIRHNVDNADEIQYKFSGVYNEADIVVDYDATTGLCRVTPQLTNIEFDEGMPISVLDCATGFELYGEAWQGMSPEEAQEIADMYAVYNYFVPELGRFYLYMGYTVDGIEDFIAIGDTQLQIDGMGDMTVSIEAEDFYADLDSMKAKITFSDAVAECRYGCFEGLLNQAKIDAVLEGGDSILSLSESEEVALAASEGAGLYTMVAITFSANGEPLEWNSAEYTYSPASDDGWEKLGNGKYTSDIFESLFELDPVTYDVQVERNLENPSLYRIVNPYSEIYPYFNEIVYASGFNHYILYDTTDPEKVFFKGTNIGADCGAGWWRAVTTGYYLENVSNSPSTAGNDTFGALTDNVITFPENSILLTAPHMSAVGGEDGNWYYSNISGELKLVLPSQVSVDAIESDHSCPPVYYDMLGNRVSNPAKGSIVIIRNGDEVTKPRVR